VLEVSVTASGPTCTGRPIFSTSFERILQGMTGFSGFATHFEAIGLGLIKTSENLDDCGDRRGMNPEPAFIDPVLDSNVGLRLCRRCLRRYPSGQWGDQPYRVLRCAVRTWGSRLRAASTSAGGRPSMI
jgi:hypothetical protein